MEVPGLDTSEGTRTQGTSATSSAGPQHEKLLRGITAYHALSYRKCRDRRLFVTVDCKIAVGVLSRNPHTVRRESHKDSLANEVSAAG